MRFVVIIATLVWLMLGFPAAAEEAKRVLFVGNSLTYVGNVPAIVESLAAANGQHVQAKMIVKGGATLTDRMSDESIERALESESFHLLIAQERGGDFMCSFGQASCESARGALADLRALALQKNVKLVLLGTYQGHPQASSALVRAESEAAVGAGVPYLVISDILQQGLKAYPEMKWFAADGMHPGPALALAQAIVIFNHLFGEWPSVQPLQVNAPIYRPSSSFQPELRTPYAGVSVGVDTSITYPKEVVQKIIGLASRADG